MGLVPLLMLVACGSDAPAMCTDCGDAGPIAVDAATDVGELDAGGRDAACAPGAETCDGTDEDCDGEIDEALSQRCFNACGSGLEYCRAGAWVDCDAAPVPAETCNDLDDDCDSRIDEGIDRSMDEMNCGACGRACDAEGTDSVCMFGACQIEACHETWADCDGVAMNGCEAQIEDWSIEPSVYCGDCDTFCGAGSTCSGGRCVRP